MWFFHCNFFFLNFLWESTDNLHTSDELHTSYCNWMWASGHSCVNWTECVNWMWASGLGDDADQGLGLGLVIHVLAILVDDAFINFDSCVNWSVALAMAWGLQDLWEIFKCKHQHGHKDQIVLDHHDLRVKRWTNTLVNRQKDSSFLNCYRSSLFSCLCVIKLLYLP